MAIAEDRRFDWVDQLWNFKCKVPPAARLFCKTIARSMDRETLATFASFVELKALAGCHPMTLTRGQTWALEHGLVVESHGGDTDRLRILTGVILPPDSSHFVRKTVTSRSSPPKSQFTAKTVTEAPDGPSHTPPAEESHLAGAGVTPNACANSGSGVDQQRVDRFSAAIQLSDPKPASPVDQQLDGLNDDLGAVEAEPGPIGPLPTEIAALVEAVLAATDGEEIDEHWSVLCRRRDYLQLDDEDQERIAVAVEAHRLERERPPIRAAVR